MEEGKEKRVENREQQASRREQKPKKRELSAKSPWHLAEQRAKDRVNEDTSKGQMKGRHQRAESRGQRGGY
jgi:hypothetical protein